MRRQIYLFSGFLLLLSLMLAGCNDSGSESLTPVVEEGDPAATPAVSAGEALTETEGVTETVPATEALTGTQTLTVTIPTTAGTGAAPSEPVTGTVGVTETGAVSPTAAMAVAGVQGAENLSVRASDLMGFNVQNMDTDNLGEIDNLIIDLSTGQVLFANLSFGGFLDLGDKTFPIPLGAFALGPDNQTLYLNVPEETLQNAPGFDDNWPDPTVVDWDVETDHFWRDLGIQMNPLASGNEAAVIARSSELLGSNVQNPAGEDLGEIDDLIIDLGTGVVDYAVMSFGGFLGIGEDHFAIPLSAFQRTVVRDIGYNVNLVLDVTEAQLQNAPVLEDNWPDPTNPDWDAGIRDFWGVETPVTTTVTPAVADTGETATLVTIFDPTSAPVRVSDLIGQPVYDVDGAALGQIQDFVMGTNDAIARYVVLAAAAGASNGDLIPIPVGALLRKVDDQALVVNAPSDTLAGAPRFTGDEWPAVVYTPFEQDIYDYWASAGYPSATIYPARTATAPGAIGGLPALALTATDFLGRSVVNRDEQEIGAIEDLIYAQGYVRYALLSLNDQKGLTVVPLYALFYSGANDTFLLDTPPDQLANAPHFDEASWTEPVPVDWDANINDYWENTVGVPARLGVRSLATTKMLASNIIGSDVQGADQADLGDIEDLVVDARNGDIRYAIVSFGGFLGLGEDYFVVPLEQLTLDPYLSSFSTALTEQSLEGAPHFTADSWPNFNDPNWDADFRAFWQREGITATTALTTTESMTGSDATNRAAMNLRATALWDYAVVDANGNDIADVDDLVVDFFNSRATFMVVGIGGFLDIGEKEVALPFDYPQVDVANRQVLLDVDQATVEAAPEFDPALWNDIANEQWLDDATQYWSARQ